MVVGEMIEERDVIVIGGGPGGYHAAIRAAQLGKHVTLIEKSSLGGACLKSGCIPSKYFAEAAKKMKELHSISDFGITIPSYHIDLDVLQKEKDKKISTLQKGIELLIKSNKIERVEGEAHFLGNDRIGVENGLAFTIYRFKSAVIATGSKREERKEIDHKRVFNYESIYSIKEIPEHLIVNGSDYLSLEIVSIFHQLGSNLKPNAVQKKCADCLALPEYISK